ncbi:MAG TPA: dihydrolipoamide acetyltransferase family protein [Terriglobales bacterium]|nr:dihydrolipoamide acetyltransferase family protein [Terriglobales bacterium]
MPTDVIMPQMGESIFEGTLTKWLKKPGDKVQRDEPLFEISTDKVDAEIPAPASGTLAEIKVAEGTTVQVNTVVGLIAAEGEAVAAGGAKPAPAPTKAAAQGEGTPASAGVAHGGKEARTTEATSPAEGAKKEQRRTEDPTGRKGAGAREATAPGMARAGEEETEISTQLRGRRDVEPEAKPLERQAVAQQKDTVIEFPANDRDQQGRRIRSSPLVRRIARDNNLNLGSVQGTGLGGRITKNDIQAFLSQHGAGAPAAAAASSSAPQRGAAAPAQAPYTPPQRAAAAPQMVPAGVGTAGEVVPMTNMRKKIAEHMVASKATSAHVHTVFEVDMSRIAAIRARQKPEWEARNGAKLTYMPFIAQAAVNAIRQFPVMNSSIEGDSIHYKREINLGIAVALEQGLIVPVIKHAEERNFLGLARAIQDVGERARTKKLVPDDVASGTFTITNPGSYGALFGTPIISQPQVAILGMGGVHKAPVVVTDEDGNDSIAIRTIVHLVLGFDHRIIDGAVADQFMAMVKRNLEDWNEPIG